MALRFVNGSAHEASLAAGIDNLSEFTVIILFSPSQITNPRPLWGKGNNGQKSGAIRPSGNLNFRVRRAAPNHADLVTNDGPLAVGEWTAACFPYDVTDGPRVFTRSLNAGDSFVESTYASRTLGSGALEDDSSDTWKVSATTFAFDGDVQFFHLLSRRLSSVTEMNALLMSMLATSETLAFMHLGYTGNTGHDLSSGQRAVTVSGATGVPNSPIPLWPAFLGEGYELSYSEVSTADKSIAGSAAGLATTTGSLTAQRVLEGQADGAATSVGSLAAQRNLDGAATGAATTTGVFARQAVLTGLATGTGTTTGSLIREAPLSGQASGLATTDGELIAQRLLTGQANGEATTSGELESTAAGTKSLAGTATGTVSTSAGLFAQRNLLGSAVGATTTSESFVRQVPLLGATTGLGIVSGELVRQVPLSGTAAGDALTTGMFFAVRLLQGSAVGAGVTDGDLLAIHLLSGTADGEAVTSGALSLQSPFVFGPITGNSGLTSAGPRITGVEVFTPSIV